MSKKRGKLRPLGKITTELEPLLFEMIEEHELQIHEIFGIIYIWAKVHCPEAIEEYEDGSTPELVDYL